jgi:hypothetical protein
LPVVLAGCGVGVPVLLRARGVGWWVLCLLQDGVCVGEGVDDVVRGFVEERSQGRGDRPVPEQGEADRGPVPQRQQLSEAGRCEAVGAADDEVSDVVGEYPGGDGVPGGALGVGPGSVRFALRGEALPRA